jgi:hypothetical protein
MADTRSLGATRPRSRASLRRSDVAIRLVIVGLTLATGYIHSTLDGPLFTLNAIGYAVAAVAMVIPLGIATRFRWLVRLGLMGYAATAIVGSPGSPTITARGLRFDRTELVVPAGLAFTLVFDNEDGAPHNVAISDDQSAQTSRFNYSPTALTRRLACGICSATTASSCRAARYRLAPTALSGWA